MMIQVWCLAGMELWLALRSLLRCRASLIQPIGVAFFFWGGSPQQRKTLWMVEILRSKKMFFLHIPPRFFFWCRIGPSRTGRKLWSVSGTASARRKPRIPGSWLRRWTGRCRESMANFRMAFLQVSGEFFFFLGEMLHDDDVSISYLILYFSHFFLLFFLVVVLNLWLKRQNVTLWSWFYFGLSLAFLWKIFGKKTGSPTLPSIRWSGNSQESAALALPDRGGASLTCLWTWKSQDSIAQRKWT